MLSNLLMTSPLGSCGHYSILRQDTFELISFDLLNKPLQMQKKKLSIIFVVYKGPEFKNEVVFINCETIIREQGEGALLPAQLSISFVIVCFEKQFQKLAY